MAAIDSQNRYLLLTYGFIRTVWKKKDGDLPSVLVELVYSFHSHYDSWNVDYIAKDRLEIVDPFCVRVNTSMGCTMYGNEVVYAKTEDETKFQWVVHLKYKGIGQASNANKLLGLIRNDADWMRGRQNKTNWHYSSNGYLLDTKIGRLVPTYKYYGKRGCLTETGDSIKMVLHKSELSFCINGSDYGKAMDVAPGEYRICLYVCGCLGSIIEII